MMPGRLALGLILLTLAACQESPRPSPAPPPRPALPTVGLGPPAAPPPAPVPRDLCDVLPAVVATEADGFARLRAERIAADSWRASQTLPGTERCTIEGEAWPLARYSCASRHFGADDRAGAEAGFDALARKLDACLEKPIWFPHNWKKGEAFEFAMGERLLAWTDQSVSPPSQVVLKMQQDLDRRGYWLKLNVEAID
jgi:hypothetical protein